ncbi:EamA-like transporter family protein [Halopseudomonas xinjiangensis]|uniref:EamA-like transporter family protein n=1 Tax=Halopseudomonas xinjiangensis TaxID=487184 RepID=A0A1H1YAP7_9GAMM|nr:DMT family transporter [Halopseudomonas xinjiangensis]SDT18465.1 EamA-like transporter family protein [Halopseudomonas xinjiangensis]
MLRPELVLIFATLLWGTSWIPLRAFAEAGISGMPMVFASYGLIALVAVPLLWRQRRAWRGQAWGLLAIVIFGGWANTALISSLSLGHDIVRLMLLFYLAPVWAVLGGWLMLREQLTALRLGALALAMVGIALTLGIGLDTLKPLEGVDWLALSAGFAFAMNNLATRAANRIPLFSKTFAAFIGSVAFAGVACLLLDQGLPTLRPVTWALVALFAAGWLLATLAAQYGVTHLEASRAAVIIVFELIAAVLSAAWLGDVPLGPRECVGAALVCVAAVLAAWPDQPQPALPRSAT